jgi:ferritin-like metal-binding protein YciE
MKLFSANIDDLRSLYIDSLQKALDMEQKITKALPTMIDKSTDADLAAAFADHLRKTEGHAAMVESILRQATGDARTTTCKVISALTSEAEDMIKDAIDPSIRDVSLIAAAQQVEHHEMAVYGTLRTWATLLGEEGQAELLDNILEDEKDADDLLTEISERINTIAEAKTAFAPTV